MAVSSSTRLMRRKPSSSSVGEEKEPILATLSPSHREFSLSSLPSDGMLSLFSRI